MKQTIRLVLLAGIAAGTFTFAAGDRVIAQAADPNAAPNPYKMQEDWAQLPSGRKFGARSMRFSAHRE